MERQLVEQHLQVVGAPGWKPSFCKDGLQKFFDTLL
jgi:hypothetical protein